MNFRVTVLCFSLKVNGSFATGFVVAGGPYPVTKQNFLWARSMVITSMTNTSTMGSPVVAKASSLDSCDLSRETSNKAHNKTN